MIETSYFRKPDLPLDRCVAISRSVPRGWKGRRYPALEPDAASFAMYKARCMSWEQYVHNYQMRVLARLDPMEVGSELDGSIVCCWEKDRAHCHRALVADWLAFIEPVPEWSAPRGEQDG